MSEKKTGFIGAGNMATAIINGILKNKAKSADKINVFDLDSEKLNLMSQKGVNCMESGKELVKNSDIIVLAVKPQNYDSVLNEIKDVVEENKVFVTIAAGISIEYVQTKLEKQCPMVRVMPNTPLLLGKGATAMCRSESITDEDFDEVYKMFALSGDVAILPESQMNEIIAVNGSSPAYIYLFAKSMVDYAVSVGIDRDTALTLICKTFEGSAEMLRSSGDSPETLIEKVSSKGGTTIEAMKILNEREVPKAIFDAMAACTKRAEELGK
ncbi:MAG: pyrroline-5-carboxylate reductase [Clostridia bacterium]|nr:pyrroline-5-carboxylate reductase [Clostridia bacterium]